MDSKLIVMLTHNDRTHKNATTIFNECVNLPIDYWGFKNVGISENEMCNLHQAMKAAGKTTFLEIVTYSEKTCLDAAKFACNHNFDYLLGTIFYPSVWEYLKDKPIQYYPFVGNVSGSPSTLNGSAEQLLLQAKDLYDMNVPGIDLLAFRHKNTSPMQLSKEIVSQAKQNVIIAGSIDSIERIKFITEIKPWAFTIGSALFTGKFISGAGFKSNLEKVLEIISTYDTKSCHYKE